LFASNLAQLEQVQGRREQVGYMQVQALAEETKEQEQVRYIQVQGQNIVVCILPSPDRTLCLKDVGHAQAAFADFLRRSFDTNHHHADA
jgi:peroxiredoxin